MKLSEILKQKLNRKAEDVFNSREENFSSELRIFYDFIEKEGILRGALIELENHEFNVESYLARTEIHRRFIRFPDNELDKVCLCSYLMKKFANKELSCLSIQFLNITSNGNIDVRCHEISRLYFKPVYDYFYERIVDNSTMLYILDKYRHRTEWFHKKRLSMIYTQDTAHGEDNLTLDLQEYLHDQGVDFPFSTPHSPIGRADLVSGIDTKDPLVLEVKIFNTENGYDKAYIRKGLTQAYKYAIDYGKTTGYLLIYNVDKKEITFEMDAETDIKKIQIGNKIIYIIVVDLFINSLSASELKKTIPYVIEDAYLKNLEE